MQKNTEEINSNRGKQEGRKSTWKKKRKKLGKIKKQ